MSSKRPLKASEVPKKTRTLNPQERRAEGCHPSLRKLRSEPSEVSRVAIYHSFKQTVNLWHYSGGYNIEFCRIYNAPQAIILTYVMRLVRCLLDLIQDALRFPPGNSMHFQLIYLGSSRGIIMNGTKHRDFKEDGL
jgi:hypothetical protein